MPRRSPLPRYDHGQTYAWNYEHAPAPDAHPDNLAIPAIPGDWDFCGLPVASPLGIAAGPLLNGAWCLYYARLGFDVLTYKTVRSTARNCYPMPNLVPVDCPPLDQAPPPVIECPQMRGSWAVSFGMPSAAPEIWREDIRSTRRQLADDKLLSVSVVGTVQEGWTTDQLADDYAQCAAWAVSSGADVIEANFSCPNVVTCDGQLYQQPADAGRVAQRVRDAIGNVPLIIKVGHLTAHAAARQLIDALAPSVSALAMTNSIATVVRRQNGQPHFEGQTRGICGAATYAASTRQVAMFHKLLSECGSGLQLIGVGGAASAGDVAGYLERGAHAVHVATAAMRNPRLASHIKQDWK